MSNIQKVTNVLREVYEEPQTALLMREVLRSRTVGDKAVYLRDLIDADRSSLKENKLLMAALKDKGVSLSTFASNFSQKVSKTNDVQLQAFVNNLKAATSVKTVQRSVNPTTYSYYENQANGGLHELTIYEPYPFEESTDEVYGSLLPTLVAATADADEGIGYRPVYNSNNQLLRYDEVLVNDDYAEQNPTLIIGVNGIEPDIVDNAGIPVSYDPGTPIVVPNLPRRVLKVDIGEVTCTKQYDALISFTGNGGGSEIRFTRADAYLKVQDGQVLADNFLTPGPSSISRKDIRKKRAVTFSAEWDGDWEVDNLQQFMAVYEEDNANTAEIGGKLTTTMKISDSVGIGTEGNFKITYKSKDEIIYQGKLNRDVFEALNVTDLGCGRKGGWAIRNCSSPVRFTMWHQVYIGN
ncbi:hypothetical protein ABDK00_017490 [Niabella insulamsoli]|uniref:hypothetical protein n=1 Tax=Niabella insulamsoli TaxID=3144874 RepID=UPI0031FD0E2D